MALFNIFKKKPKAAVESTQSNVMADFLAQSVDQLQKCNQFWAEFKQEKKRLLELEPRELVTQTSAILEKYFDGVVAEFEQNEKGEFKRLVISANGIIDHFRDVMLLTQNAPRIDGVEVVAFRQRVGEGSNFGINMQDFTLNTTDIMVKMTPLKGRINFEIAWRKEIPTDMLDHAKQMSIIMQDHILGEYDSAVKVRWIDFIETPIAEDEREGWATLPEIPEKFDQMWLNDLGHTQSFPEGEHKWLSFQLTNDDEDDVVLGMLNSSANSIACRADLGTRLDITIDVPQKELLERIYEYEEALITKLQPHQLGIHALTLFPLQKGERTLFWHVSDEHSALQTAVEVAKLFPDLSMTFNTEYDPRWEIYLEWAPEE